MDASFNIKECTGRLGWEAQIIDLSNVCNGVEYLIKDNVENWRSRKCNRMLASTSSVELLALLEGAKSVPTYMRLIELLLFKMP